MGIITRVWVKVLPMYNVRIVRKRETFASALEGLPANVASNRNYEFFWFPKSDLVYSKAMNIVEGEKGSGMTAGRWVSDIINENLAMWFICTINHNLPASRGWLLDKGSGLVPQGTSVTRADAAYATERLVVHQEMEYAVPADKVVDVLRKLEARFRAFDTRTLFPVEVRFTRNDDLFLSASYGRDVAWIAVHTWWKEDHLEYFDAAETIFLEADGRPHWGKLHNLNAADLQKKYPKWNAFNAARKQLDPKGLFENQYLNRLLAN
jgi:FAD/FMN-containing dehydrogenase